MIFHCSENREKEQVWSKMLRIMGVAEATAGAQMAMEPPYMREGWACPCTRPLRQLSGALP